MHPGQFEGGLAAGSREHGVILLLEGLLESRPQDVVVFENQDSMCHAAKFSSFGPRPSAARRLQSVNMLREKGSLRSDSADILDSETGMEGIEDVLRQS